MKKMFLNKAIVSYANFVKQVVTKKDNEKVVSIKEQYKKFLEYYKSYKSNEFVMFDSSSIISCPEFSGMELVKIYYSDIIQVWAFVHILVVKKTKNKNIMNLSNMSAEIFAAMKKALHSLWYAPHHDETYDYVYLDEDEVILEVQCSNMKKQLERSSEVLRNSVEQMECIFA